MKTMLELVCEQLHDLDARLVMRNRDIASVCRVEALGQGAPRDAGCLYVADAARVTDELLSSACNLVIPDVPSAAQRVLSGDRAANVITLGRTVATQELLERLGQLMGGIERIRGHSLDLMGAVASGPGLRRFVEAAAGCLGNPLVVMRADYHAMAASSLGAGRDAMWDDFAYRSITRDPSEWPGEYQGLDPKDFLPASERPLVVNVEGSYDWLRGSVWRGGTCRYLLFSASLLHPFEEGDLLVMAFLRELLASHYLGEAAGRHTDSGSLVISAITGNEEDEGELLLRAAELGLTLSPQSVMVTLFNERKRASYQEVLRTASLARGGLVGHVTTSGFQVVCVLTGHRAGSTMDADVQALLKGLAKDWKAARSLPFSSPTGLEQAYGQCETARTLGRAGASHLRVYDFARFSLRRLIDLSAEVADLGELVDPLAWQLLDYDRENGTEYARTLYWYVRTLRQTDLVAREVHVHRNTVVYRVGRARELFGIDVGDPVAMSSLALSLDVLMRTRPELVRM